MSRGHFALWLVAGALAAGCSGATSGSLVSVPAPGTVTTLSKVTTFEHDGLRVWWNGPVERGSPREEAGFAAVDQQQHDALWWAVGMVRPAPRVDFTREIVFGFAGPGGAPGWNRDGGRFYGGYDAHGRNVHGWASMQRYRSVRAGADRVRIFGPSSSVEPGPILPPTAAPILEEPRAAYTHAEREVLTDFASLAEGHLALLATDVVWGLSGRAQLCRAPDSDAAAKTFVGCAASAPFVASSRAKERRGVLVLDGPVLVRRLGDKLADVVVTANPSLRVVGVR